MYKLAFVTKTTENATACITQKASTAKTANLASLVIHAPQATATTNVNQSP